MILWDAPVGPATTACLCRDLFTEGTTRMLMMGVTHVGHLGGRAAHVGPLRGRAGHVGRLRSRAEHVGRLRGREAAPDESRRRNASRLRSQGRPRRGGASNHIQLV